MGDPDEPTAKVDPLTPRVVPLAESAARARRAAAGLPVTRLSDLTPLDVLGLPVWCAVTPLAADLTTHMGKGATPEAARASALMEAIERVSAERLPAARWRGAAMACDGRTCVDPTRFHLPPDTAWDPAGEFTWCAGIELFSGAEAWLPADLVINPPREGLIGQPDTNGLAAGNTWLEAVLHGLCEVIERDAAGRTLFAAYYAEAGDDAPAARRLDPATPPASCRPILAAIAAAGLAVSLHDLTQDVRVPTLRAALVDPAAASRDGVGVRRCFGLGCDPNAEVALSRALSEAVQSRLAMIQGARDSFNGLPRAARRATRRELIGDLRGGGDVDFAAIPSFRSDDLARDLKHVLGALARAGFREAYAIDLTDPAIGLPVVRVRVPGLSSFFVDRSRVAWRDLSCLV